MLEDQTVAVTRIDCRIEPYHWVFAREEAARIDTHWDALRQTKQALFDGRVLLSHRLSIDPADGGTLQGGCFETGYKSFLSWRDFGSPGVPVANCFGMPALLSSDGAFMLGEMSASTANAGALYFPAGTPEPSDADATGWVDYDRNILRELQEETGIAAHEVTLDPLWTIVAEGPRVACVKIARVAETAQALQTRLASFNEGEADPELARLVPVRHAADVTGGMPLFMRRYLEEALPRL